MFSMAQIKVCNRRYGLSKLSVEHGISDRPHGGDSVCGCMGGHVGLKRCACVASV